MGQYTQRCIYLLWKTPHFHAYRTQKPRTLTNAGTYLLNLLSDNVIVFLFQDMKSYTITSEENVSLVCI